ncbi:type VI secretion system-associated FHA domain protein TagH [Rheinheimera muenzenbergensis]|uniref:Type VI secretion system-associated FHA domain protein TagH n=1 Tax=Rheinheimera muenzenbergensis TaxID=1193628 RepID=A0ABU8C6V6_9GAMM
MDMLLELSVLSYHRLSPRQVAVKRFDSAGGTLGRSEQSDWCLPDPERVVSGVHALIHFSAGNYSIVDKSTNGLFVNRAVEALGAGNSHTLQHGDILCLGDYEIQVALVDAGATAVSADNSVKEQHSNASDKAGIAPATAGLLIDDLMAPLLASRNANVTTNSNPQSAVAERPAMAPAQPAELDQHFLAPAAMIPDDWDNSWQVDELQPQLNSTASSPLPRTQTAAPAKATSVNDDACMQAFLRGLAVADVNAQTLGSAVWWEQLGLAFAQSLQGVLSVMRERSQVKNRFRVNQTTFQQRENNPLKFSANLEDAFYNLFNRPGSSFMPAKQALAEAFADISQHEAAIIAGAKGAMAGMLVQLAPEKLEATDIGGGLVDKLNPAQRQARCWARYKLLHQELLEEMQRKEHSGVNDDFIAAYEAYLRRKS